METAMDFGSHPSKWSAGTNLHRCHASLSRLPYGQEDCFRRRALWSKVKGSAKTCLLEHLLDATYDHSEVPGTTSFLDEVDDCLRKNQTKMAADLFCGSISNFA